ncbi:PREDICTED: testis-specific serine/threonine-protein kinase 3-like, partial [Rhagoletis zephyria]|uniref:testis-specific serine/threonine-protein kinase 3-like n=1 Tax=Rhagoletis zephyria TaxID=28612 RepID=UPI000811682A
MPPPKEETLTLNEQTMNVFKKKGYTIQKKLSEGAFGQVFKGTYTKTEQDVAIKVMFLEKLDAGYKDKFWPRELEALISIRHEHVISIFDIIKADGKLFIFMEYANGGDLADYLKKNGAMPETIACYWFTQATQALAYMHDKVGMAHRDIKIDNLLLHNHKVKVTDFGFARQVVNKKGEVILSGTFCGTLPYQSPEIIAQKMYDPIKADCWAMGVTLFCMLNNKFVFHYDNEEEMLKEQTSGADFVKSRYTRKFPADLRDLQEKLLHPSEAKRLSMAQALKHPWIVRKG